MLVRQNFDPIQWNLDLMSLDLTNLCALHICSKVKITDIASQNTNVALLDDENCIELHDRSHLCYKSLTNKHFDRFPLKFVISRFSI